jgi:alkylation response protein AidB-like acyl-CoA dehydrogenase
MAAARRALAAEIVGVVEAALAVAVAHTIGREQFGRPIGSFQAVRHQLAEAHVALTAARSMLDAARTAPDPAWAAMLAKLQAGRSQAAVMRNAVQVSGAMGLSQEGAMHRYVARAHTLDALYGGHVALACSAGATLLAGATLDPVVEV